MRLCQFSAWAKWICYICMKQQRVDYVHEGAVAAPPYSKRNILQMHDWIWDLPTLHIIFAKSVFKIEQVVACGKRESLSREIHVSEPAERCSSSLHVFYNGLFVALLDRGTIRRMTRPSCTPLELIYKPFFSDLRVCHLLLL